MSEVADRYWLASGGFVARIQATGAFAPSIPAPGDADPQAAFLYFTGRRP
jgi:hypothetical protein